MKSISERPPILTVHEDQGDYILRVGDTKYRHLVVGLSKLLTDAKRLIVVTPGDVKFFTVEEGGQDDDILGKGGSGGDRDVDTGDYGGTSPVGEEVTNEASSQLPQQEESPPPGKLTRRRKPLRDDVKVGRDENCQRCAGSGKTTTLMPDNSTAESMCPICQGDGVIKRYGVRRQ